LGIGGGGLARVSVTLPDVEGVILSALHFLHLLVQSEVVFVDLALADNILHGYVPGGAGAHLERSD